MILSTIEKMPKKDPAIHFQGAEISYGELVSHVNNFHFWLTNNNISSLALLSDNCPEWLIIDLACQKAGIIFIPIPTFFSKSQISYLLTSAQPEVFMSSEEFTWGETLVSPLVNFYSYQPFVNYNHLPPQYPENTRKLTFTSGSTGRPKGVCLSIENQEKVARSLVDVISIDRPTHLVLLPLSTLL